MKDKLVLTISIGDYYNEISKYTLNSIKNYATKIGADFLNITDSNDKYITQKWNKFNIYKLLNKYRRIIYFDIDILIRDDTPDLFDIVPEHKLGMFNEGKYAPRYEYLKQASEFYNEPLKEWKGNFYNSGVMVISRQHKQIFKLPRGFDRIETDQPYINLRINVDEVNMFDLHYDFNRMDLMDDKIGISRLNSYIIHYAGAPKEQIFNVLLNDIQNWPYYKYQQNILISVSAGMGDQLASEPVVRYIRKIYPDSIIHVVTHHPRLFEHIENINLYSYDMWNGLSEPVLEFHTCPDDKKSEHNLSHVLFHPTDFASMSTIRRNIPHIDKRIKLNIYEEDTNSILEMIGGRSFDDVILIHPGKWWASKTFPVEWWQEVIDGLSQKLFVGLIGKRIDEKQGYQPVECPENGFDFRDITALGELISLISLSPCVLTNDSSPLHIAGAFDNWIVTIPTCKHPDHILPYRNGTQYYKIKTLYKKLLVDDIETRHTEFYVDNIDNIPEGRNIYEYIPEPQYVIDEVLKIYKK